MSTIIGMSFLVRNMLGVTREYSEHILVEDLLPSLLQWWDEHSHKDGKDESASVQGWTISPNEAYLSFLPSEAQRAVNGDAENIVSVTPPITFHALYGGSDWVIIEFQSMHLWFFYYNHKLLPIPKNCHIEADGTVRVTCDEFDKENHPAGTRIYRFEPDFNFEYETWPWVLRNPLLHAARQRLENLIEPKKARVSRNPLAELRRSPRPYRILGHEITDELQEILELLDASIL